MSVNVLDTSIVVEIVAPAGAPGDMNCDCVVNLLDVEPFILALLDPAQYAAQYVDCDTDRADVNADLVNDALDVQDFVDLLVL